MTEQQSSTTSAPVNPGPAPGTLAHQVAQLINERLRASAGRLAALEVEAAAGVTNYASLAATLRMASEAFRELAGYADVIAQAHAAPPTGGLVSLMPEAGEVAPERTTDMTREAILSLAGKNHKAAEIARALGLKASKVRRVLRKAGHPAEAPAAAAPAAHNGAKKKGGKKAAAGTPFDG